MRLSLAEFPIYKQILIGYSPVLVVLIFLALISFQNFQKFDSSFSALQDITKENVIFLEIEKDIVQLQRNVLVYSYVGYKGVLQKIKILQKSLEKKFNLIEPIVKQDKEIEDRFNRMFKHYESYKENFLGAIEERGRIEALDINMIQPLIQSSNQKLKNIKKRYRDQNNFQMAYQISDVQYDLLQANLHVKSFRRSPDSIFISETRALILNIEYQIKALESDISDEIVLQNMNEFLKILEEYKDKFNEIIRINRSYLNLVNVVLAGKAAEMDTLSKELDTLINQRSSALVSKIERNSGRSQKQFILISLFAGFVGVLSSLFVAAGIARPVSAMARTLYDLSKGKLNVVMPGRHRKDEVGQMAEAAHEFRVMAKDLDQQTQELEEFAYRTSHDLRSPLVSSIALLQLSDKALKNKDYTKAAKSMSLASGSLIKLETLVKDILELTKTKNVEEDNIEINVHHVFEETLKNMMHMNHYDRIEFHKDFQFKGKFQSQKSRITLLVENFISNAIKYQDVSKKKSFVKIKTYSEDNKFVFEVEDNGLGIPEKQQDQLFSMFKRFHPRVSFGSGLGLYMIKKSVDILGGEVFYEDTGSGTTFKVILPNNK